MTRIERKSKIPSLTESFFRDESGSTAIEYGLIVALIFLAILSAVTGFTDRNKEIYSTIESALTN